MVNRGGRSKACITCRKRRIKCEGLKPKCKRCVKAGLTCAYVQHAEFVDESRRFLSQKPRNAFVKCLDSTEAWEKTTTKIVVPTLSNNLLIDQESLLLAHLAYRFLPPDNGPSCPRILPQLVTHAIASPADAVSKAAVQALAAVYFGKMHCNVQVMQQGRRSYVQALGRVRVALDSPKTAVEIDTLAGVLCLGLFENIAFTAHTAWLKHYEGIANLIRLRGPRIQESGLGNELFRHCRFAVVVASLLNRTHCFLSQPEWKPSQAIPQSDSEALHDIFVGVPGIRHDIDLVHRGACSASFVISLRQRVQATLVALNKWLQNWARVPSCILSALTGHDSWAVSDMALLAMHHAILLCLAPACQTLAIPLIPPQSVGSLEADKLGQMISDVSSVDTYMLAAEICHLSKLCLAEQASSTGGFLCIFPLQVALRYLPPEEAAQAEALGTTIAEVCGFEVGRLRRWGEILNYSA